MSRVFGGPPLLVILKLVILSVLVGGVLSFLGLTPSEIYARALDTARALWHMGYDAFDMVFEYLLVGAMIVVPIWLISRLVSARR